MSDHYTYRVLWSQDDGEFIGLCAEFPSLSHLAPDQIEALVGIRALVNDVVADMVQHGEQVPESFAERAYSGRFVTRVPSDLHRRLVIEAAEEGVSLNRLVSNRLASPPMVVLKNSRSPRPPGVKKREYA